MDVGDAGIDKKWAWGDLCSVFAALAASAAVDAVAAVRPILYTVNAAAVVFQ